MKRNIKKNLKNNLSLAMSLTTGIDVLRYSLYMEPFLSD